MIIIYDYTFRYIEFMSIGEVIDSSLTCDGSTKKFLTLRW